MHACIYVNFFNKFYKKKTTTKISKNNFIWECREKII